jgi:hypothetical protein
VALLAPRRLYVVRAPPARISETNP